MELPAQRKWTIRKERHAAGGWIVTAPSGNRRWFATWTAMQWLCPGFVFTEKWPNSPSGIRDLDGGVRI